MITDIIKNNILPPTISETGVNVLALMGEYNLTELPVMNGEDEFIGIINEKNIKLMDDSKAGIYSIQNDIKNISTNMDTHLFETIHIFSNNHISILPVLNEQNKYMGYVTLNELMQKLDCLQDLQTNNFIAIISSKPKDYSLSHMSRLIEENNGNIILLWSEIEQTQIKIHLLIDCPNSQRVIQALERHGYLIITKSLNKASTDDLDDRFQSFLKYLNP
ncbi:CBS domain-containing protein [Flavobacteriales bacterium]|nr:CBS domain-containing protein [Flavobacteriales bacterium]